MRVPRRAVFFAAVALVCLLLAPATPSAYRWVNFSMGGLAVFWAVMAGIEELLMHRRGRRQSP